MRVLEVPARKHPIYAGFGVPEKSFAPWERNLVRG